MQPTIYSFDGNTTINDGSHFLAGFNKGTFMGQTQSMPQFIDRPHFAPLYTHTSRGERYLVILVRCLGTLHSDIDTLKKLFPTQEDGPLKRFVFQDAANSNKQWYIDGAVVSFVPTGTLVTITLACPDPIWTAVTQIHVVWSVTATGQTQTITPDGTYPCNPIIDVTPTGARGAGTPYRRQCIIYNKTNRAFSNYPIDITNGGINTATLVADTSKSNQINQVGGIDAVVTTIPIDTAVGGGLAPSGLAYVDTEQIYYTGNSGTQLTGVTRGVNGTTAATHADNAVITRSKAQADGEDMTVIIDGLAVPRWLYNMNASATQIWVSIRLSATQTCKLPAAMGSGALTNNLIQLNSAAATFLNAIPITGLVLIDNELFLYTGKDTKKYTLTGVTRAAKGTTAATHVINSAVTWIEHDIQLAYGNANIASLTNDDTQKPVFLLSSTNSSWVYTGANFWSTDGKRSGSWTPSVAYALSPAAVRNTEFYTDVNHSFADPANYMGLSIRSWLSGTTQKAESANLFWQLFHPAGVTAVVMNGNKYRVGASWPGTMALQKNNSTNPTTPGGYSNVWNQATPGTPSSWTAFTGSPTSLSGTYYWLRLYASGGVAAGASNEAAIEVNTVTLTLAAAGVPSVTLNAELVTTVEPAFNLTNNLTGDYITVDYIMDLNETLRVDTEAHTVTYKKDGSSAFSALTLSNIRHDWLKLEPGVVNTLQYDDVSTGPVTIDIYYNERAS